MTIPEFKQTARRNGQFYDNSKSAGQNWARTWGLTWWRDVWFYQEYTLGNLTYRTGKVCTRHSSHSRTECIIDGQEVSDNKFRSALSDLPIPPFNPTLIRASASVRTQRLSHRDTSPVSQLSFAF